jgi:alkylation response protein AidB-like acyl-CoA dehydrogenase
VAALGLAALGTLLERCRIDRLTRNQHLLFRLGELIAHVETAAVFAERALSHPTRAIPLDVPTRQAMARVFARDAAAKVASEGLKWASGANQTDPGLGSALGTTEIFAAQAGLIDDMTLVAERLCAAFPPE